VSASRRDARALAIGSAVSGLLAYLVFALTTRGLGAAQAGPVSVLWSYWSFAGAAFTFPIQHWVARSVPAHGEVSVRRSIPLLSLVILGSSLLLGGLAWLARESLFHRSDAWFPLMVAAITFGSALIGGVGGGLSARGRFVAVAWSLVAENGVRCAAAGVLLVVGDTRVVAYGLCLVAGSLVVVLWPSALRFGTEGDATGGPHPFAFLAGASVSQLIGQVVLTGPPVLLALAGGAPGDVTTLFAALALLRAPYMLALGMVAQLTTWVTRAVVTGNLSALARMRVRLRLATLVTVALAAGGAALLGPFVLPLVFGPDVTLGSFAMALIAAGCALAVTNLVLVVSGLAQGRSSSVAWCWVGSVLAAGVTYVALTGLPLEDTVIWSFLAAETVAFALLSVVEARAPRHAPGISRRSGAGLGRGQEDG
jgi:O-antigen/teichoic acid export membrane protein